MPGLTLARGDARGATSVVVAVCLIVLLGFAALSLDVAAAYNDRQRLQVAADAGALAVAADCARGQCGAVNATARHYVAANTTNPTATAAVLGVPTPAAGLVTVVATDTTTHWFAPILGHDSSVAAVRATARWGAPASGRAMLPLTFGWCEWFRQTGGVAGSSTAPVVIRTTKTSGTGCTKASGLLLPGGFGWLSPNAGGCAVDSSIGGLIFSDPGNSPSCDVSTVASFQGQVVMLPIFDLALGSGASGRYRVMGYAAFRMTGYYFAGHYSWNPPCSGNDRCIAGVFVAFVTDSDWRTGLGAVDLGASIVTLTA